MRLGNLVTSLIALIFLVLAGSLSYTVFRDSQPPYSIISAEAINPILSGNDTLRIQYHIVKFKSCPTAVDRFIIMTPSGEVIYRDSVPGGSSNIGESSPITSINLPSLPKGTYIYRSAARITCGFYSQSVISPDVTFEVI